MLAAIGLLIKDVGAKGIWALLVPVPLVVAGMVVSLWWRQLIDKYKRLVGLRIDKLREMEEDMPEWVRMYHAEDKLYPRADEKKMISEKGRSISDLEKRLPWLFLILYILFGIGLLIALLDRLLPCIMRIFD